MMIKGSGMERVAASSAFMVEALAVLKALFWARKMNLDFVEIVTDCLLVVKGLSNIGSPDVLVQSILYDILEIYSCFSYVCVVKVPRQMVEAAHALAKDCNR